MIAIVIVSVLALIFFAVAAIVFTGLLGIFGGVPTPKPPPTPPAPPPATARTGPVRIVRRRTQ